MKKWTPPTTLGLCPICHDEFYVPHGGKCPAEHDGEAPDLIEYCLASRLDEAEQAASAMFVDANTKLANLQADRDDYRTRLDEAIEALERICEIGETRDVQVARAALANLS